MRDVFVETENVRKFLGALADLEHRGAKEACMVVVDGKPGLGKTSAMARWQAQNDAVYIRAQVGWDGTMFIHNLLRELGEEPPRSKAKRYERVIELLFEKYHAAQIARQPFGWIVDECDLVAGKREVMETIRGISDALQIPTILVGMGTLRDMIKRYPQIESRAPRRVRFDLATLGDVQALIEKRCEVPVAPDLVEFVHRASSGFNREVVEAIGYIERFGHRLDDIGEGVSVADMAGQVIMHNRNTGSAVAVPGAY
ncbi:DNA transposition AAA+ family ATPase [Rhodobacter aestuarii]|uniref:DNA transposition protein, AAA+ family ATPase n=1 Tax=Rhodobacter aestuarii TaxID=453582 RepID=A0A1N7Q2R6_9RHOB|nr:AAA family ATPase [Rhodobacter aestuarii]PTV94048.1 DNA transposition AAA+ family ATPase [Rhodobacter aestuarii]SIT16969.1 DNA transposition protein, AAA+ family ATPase [Rhodobacter aestuarii]